MKMENSANLPLFVKIAKLNKTFKILAKSLRMGKSYVKDVIPFFRSIYREIQGQKDDFDLPLQTDINGQKGIKGLTLGLESRISALSAIFKVDSTLACAFLKRIRRILTGTKQLSLDVFLKI